MAHLLLEDETFCLRSFVSDPLNLCLTSDSLFLSLLLHTRKCVRPFEPVLTYRFPFSFALFSSSSSLDEDHESVHCCSPVLQVADHEVENVFDRESSCELSFLDETSDYLDEAATNTDDASAALAKPAGLQAFFEKILNDSNHKNVFHVDKIDNNVDAPIDDENAKNEELRELSVSTSYGRGDYNAIVLQSL